MTTMRELMDQIDQAKVAARKYRESLAPADPERVSCGEGEALSPLEMLQQLPLEVVREWPRLAAGDFLVNHEKNSREYRGAVEIGASAACRSFRGVTHWGPSGRGESQRKVVYEGDSLPAAIRAVNLMINKKLSGGYEIKGPPDIGEGQISYTPAIGELKRLHRETRS